MAVVHQTSSPPRSLTLPQCDHRPQPYDGPSRDEVIALRHQYVSPGVITYYKDPLMIVEGHMQYLFDETGKRYLDAFAGIVTVSVGHCHPYILEKVRAQTNKLQHTTTIYLNPTLPLFAKKLAEKMPSGLSRSYFTNSGSEANEIAILSSREYTGNNAVIALRNCYHGGTASTMGLTAHSSWKFKSNSVSNVHHTHAGYCYRCPYGLTYPSCNLKCANDIKNVIQYETSGEIACFIGEPIQGVGGTVIPPKEYFGIVYDIVRQHGGLCIADEVQGGFGRTGTNYWSHQHWGVKPDIITMAKGIGNGAPLGAMTTTEPISEVMKRRVHFNTFGGNPITMTQGLATLEVIDAEGIQENAHAIGGYLKEALEDLQLKYELIGEVRGLGLMLGVELVTDRASRTPAKNEAATIMEELKKRQVIVGKGGLFGNVLRIKPPMCINRDDAGYLIAMLDEVLEGLQSGKIRAS